MNESAVERQINYSLQIRRLFTEKPIRVKEENKQHYFIISLVAYIGFITHAFYLTLFWAIDVRQLAYFNVLSVFLYALAIILNRRGFHFVSLTIGMGEVFLHQTLCVIFIGWGAGFQYYILLCPIGVYLLPHGHNFYKCIVLLFGLFNYSLLDYFYRVSDPLINLNASILSILNYGCIVIFVGILSYACYFYNTKIYEAETALHKEQGKVEKAYSLLSKYVAPQLADTISGGQIDSIWEHNRKKLTLFFSDIKDFTSITDSMEPEDMASVLNEYLTEMNTIINEYKGTLAQVIGDGLYVFFGAPESVNDRDHALRCVKMAVDMQRKMTELNKRWFKKGIDEVLLIRCGINTGMATVGGYGSSERKEYTAMGMQTNIAARLEQNCKPGGILLSHTTWALVNDEISCSEQEQIKVKGLNKPIRAYSVDAVAGEINI